MGKKPMSVVELARMGQAAFAKRYSKAQRRAWAKLGGRRPALDAKGLGRLQAMLGRGRTHAEIADALGVSTRTISRTLAHFGAAL